MKSTYHLSSSETRIMEKLWAQSGPIKQTQLLAMFHEEGKMWGRQTLNTLLIRLEKRNFIKREKRMVWALYTKQGFGMAIMEEAVEVYFGGDWHRMAERLSKDLAERIKKQRKGEEEKS